jgi:prepilin-type N-terminal cleavage/methylation domain-containing protein
LNPARCVVAGTCYFQVRGKERAADERSCDAQTFFPKPGFTLLELLVTVAIIALLAALVLSNSHIAYRKAKRLTCLNNLRQLGIASLQLADDNGGRFPPLLGNAGTAGSWPWDIPTNVIESLQGYGPSRAQFYCPSFPEQNNDILWFFETNALSPGGEFKVIGYVLLFPNAARVLTNNTITSVDQEDGLKIIVADSVLSLGSDETNRAQNIYVGIQGAWPFHRTSHVEKAYPQGGNAFYYDGSAYWRDFATMGVRTSGTPSFWW